MPELRRVQVTPSVEVSMPNLDPTLTIIPLPWAMVWQLVGPTGARRDHVTPSVELRTVSFSPITTNIPASSVRAERVLSGSATAVTLEFLAGEAHAAWPGPRLNPNDSDPSTCNICRATIIMSPSRSSATDLLLV